MPKNAKAEASKSQEALFKDMLRDIDKELERDGGSVGGISSTLAVCICVVVIIVLLVAVVCAWQLQQHVDVHDKDPSEYPTLVFCRKGGDPSLPTVDNVKIDSKSVIEFDNIKCNELVLTSPDDTSLQSVELSWDVVDRQNLFVAAFPHGDTFEVESLQKFNGTSLTMFSNGVVQEGSAAPSDTPIIITVYPSTPWSQLLAQLPILSAATLGAAIFSAATDEKLKRKTGLQIPRPAA